MGEPQIHARAVSQVGRNDRRQLLRSEAVNRKAGSWGAWETLRFPRGSAGNGWAAEFTMAHRNRVFAVLDRTVNDGVRHLAISSLSGERPTWLEAQRIKDELAGAGATAVEVYPPRSKVVDEANMYHLWVLPAGLPFGLATRSALDLEGRGDG
jgi:hypothetical protein